MSKLIFVYNADSGYFNVVADMAHKIFSPATYPCSLCDLTYGVFKIRPEWDKFVENSPVPFVFLHKDEFVLAHPEWASTTLPLVLIEENGSMEILVSAAELDNIRTVTELKTMILERISGRLPIMH